MKKFLTFVVLMGLFIVAPTAFAATITVNSDSDMYSPDGLCSLREAVSNANNDSDGTGGDCVAGSGVDTIIFDSAMTINLMSAINITSPIILDGTSNGVTGTCSSKDLDIVMSGPAFVFENGSAGSTVKGFVMNGGGYAVSTNNTEDIAIVCNMFGVNQAGDAVQKNNVSIDIQNSSNITIGGTNAGDGNIISGAEFELMRATNSTDISILGNWFGLDITGMNLLDTDSDNQIFFENVERVTIGGATSEARNVFAGGFGNQYASSIYIIGNNDDISITGNYFGTNSLGDNYFTQPDNYNTDYIDICSAGSCGSADNTTTTNVIIGGGDVGTGNLFAGGKDKAIIMEAQGVTGVIIQGNFFGITLDGLGPLGTFSGPVVSLTGTENVLIGGDLETERNYFFGGGQVYILSLQSQQAVIKNNYFGIAPDGILLSENDNSTMGIVVVANTEILISDNEFRGLFMGVNVASMTNSSRVYNNTISNNYWGIAVGTTDFAPGSPIVQLTSNKVFDNTHNIDITIDTNGDLGYDFEVGPTPNDSGDGDTGPNDYLNTPIIHSVNAETGQIIYSLDVPAGDYRIEFFVGSGVGQAEEYLGYDSFTSTGASKQQTATFDMNELIGEEFFISATTTVDLGGDAYGATSELSQEYVPLAQPKRRSVSGTVSPEYLAQQRIVLDQSSLPSTPQTTTPSDTCPADQILTQNMRAGARNGRFHPYTKAIVTEVKILQAHMNRLGFNSGPVDGILGPITDGAIKRMQTFLGTKADGFVGPLTRALINNSCGGEGLKKSL